MRAYLVDIHPTSAPAQTHQDSTADRGRGTISCPADLLECSSDHQVISKNQESTAKTSLESNRLNTIIIYPECQLRTKVNDIALYSPDIVYYSLYDSLLSIVGDQTTLAPGQSIWQSTIGYLDFFIILSWIRVLGYMVQVIHTLP